MYQLVLDIAEAMGLKIQLISDLISNIPLLSKNCHLILKFHPCSSKYNRYASPSPEPLRRPPSGSRPSRGESGYHSEESRSAGGRTRASSGVSRFCHDCGTKYPVSAAKFCCECGVKRLVFWAGGFNIIINKLYCAYCENRYWVQPRYW